MSKKNIDVSTGEVKSGNHQTILESNGIGSCVVVVAYDSVKRNGALAHVMLPGRALKKDEGQKTKYASDAIEELINQLKSIGTNEKDIEACLAGGGNVLKEVNCTIGIDNLVSVEKELLKEGIPIKDRAVGGTERRTVALDTEKGIVIYTEGDSKKKVLWKFKMGDT